MNELYPATTTEFADPISTDDEEMTLFRPLLARTRLEALPLRYIIRDAHTVSDSQQPQGFSSLPRENMLKPIGHSIAEQLKGGSVELHVQKGAIRSTASFVTFSVQLPCRLAYDADEDAWSSKAFHSAVDGYGSAVRPQKLSRHTLRSQPAIGYLCNAGVCTCLP